MRGHLYLPPHVIRRMRRRADRRSAVSRHHSTRTGGRRTAPSAPLASRPVCGHRIRQRVVGTSGSHWLHQPRKGIRDVPLGQTVRRGKIHSGDTAHAQDSAGARVRFPGVGQPMDFERPARRRRRPRQDQTQNPRLNGKVERSHRIDSQELYRLLQAKSSTTPTCSPRNCKSGRTTTTTIAPTAR